MGQERNAVEDEEVDELVKLAITQQDEAPVPEDYRVTFCKKKQPKCTHEANLSQALHEGSYDEELKRYVDTSVDKGLLRKRLHSTFYHKEYDQCKRRKLAKEEAKKRASTTAGNAVERWLQLQ